MTLPGSVLILLAEMGCPAEQARLTGQKQDT